jgi:shikimate kinase
LLQGEDREQKVDHLLGIRTPIYEKAAHKIIVTDSRTIEEIIQLIIEAYEDYE